MTYFTGHNLAQESVLFLSLDSCRYDTFDIAYSSGKLPNFYSVGSLHCAQSPSYFTYGSHSAFWVGFTPGVVGSNEPLLNPKAGKLFRMSFAGHPGSACEAYHLEGANIIEGFRRLGFRTIGTGAVEWFNPANETGAVLGEPFDQFYFAGNTWSLRSQLQWIAKQISLNPLGQPVFIFLNIGETHVPYWHEGAAWDPWPSPCVPFGGDACSAKESARRQQACLEWLDQELASLLNCFLNSTIMICGDHGDCWGEDGLWEHGISHPATLTVPLLLRVRGKAINS